MPAVYEASESDELFKLPGKSCALCAQSERHIADEPADFDASVICWNESYPEYETET